MPYIGTRTSVQISTEKEEIIKKKLGKAIELIPGKSESWLMTEFTDNCHLWFKGDNSSPSAFVEVKIYGTLESSSCSNLTEEICKILNEELGIPNDRTYITYIGITEWGWNNFNF